MYEIRIDNRQLKQLERTLRQIPRAMPRVMSRALNRTASQARTKIGRALAAQSGLKLKDVRAGTQLVKANYQKWYSAIRLTQRRLGLMAFGARQTRRGVTYKKGRQRELISGAFLATMRTGHRGVFKRRGPARLPITELRGPSLIQVYRGAPEQAAQIQKESFERLQKNIDDQVKLILGRRAG